MIDEPENTRIVTLIGVRSARKMEWLFAFHQIEFVKCKAVFGKPVNDRAIKIMSPMAMSGRNRWVSIQAARRSSPVPSPAPATPPAAPTRCRSRRGRSPMPRSRRRMRVPQSRISTCATPRPAKARATSRSIEEVMDRIKKSGVDMIINFTAGMGGDMMFGSTGKADAAVACRHRHGRRHRAARACRQVPAGNLHARLRHHEFRRRRLRHDQHAGHAEGDGRADPVIRRQARGRDLRHRPSAVCQMAARPGPARRSGAWCSCAWACRGARRTMSHVDGAGSQPAGRLGLVGLLDRAQPDGLCRRWRCWPAATSASASKTIIWLDKGVLASKVQLVERAVKIVEDMGARIMGADDVRKKLKLTKGRLRALGFCSRDGDGQIHGDEGRRPRRLRVPDRA